MTLLNCSQIINSGSAWSSVVQYGADSLLCVLAAGGLLVVLWWIASRLGRPVVLGVSRADLVIFLVWEVAILGAAGALFKLLLPTSVSRALSSGPSAAFSELADLVLCAVLVVCVAWVVVRLRGRGPVARSRSGGG